MLNSNYISVNDKYIITSDKYNFILQELKTPKSGKKYSVVLGYHPSIENALYGILQREGAEYIVGEVPLKDYCDKLFREIRELRQYKPNENVQKRAR